MVHLMSLYKALSELILEHPKKEDFETKRGVKNPRHWRYHEKPWIDRPRMPPTARPCKCRTWRSWWIAMAIRHIHVSDRLLETSNGAASLQNWSFVSARVDWLSFFAALLLGIGRTFRRDQLLQHWFNHEGPRRIHRLSHPMKSSVDEAKSRPDAVLCVSAQPRVHQRHSQQNELQV